MKVGVPTEIKQDEYRVALTPAGVRELVEHGHEVVIQAGAGEGSAIPDPEFEAQGARIAPDADAVFDALGLCGLVGDGATGSGTAATALALPSTFAEPSGPNTMNAGLPAGTMPSAAAARARLPGAALSATWLRSCCTWAAAASRTPS